VRLEVALLDQCEYETAEQAAHFVLTANQRRLTTADRLGRALASRSRHRWRGLLRQILDEAKDGVASPLELQYRRIVEAAHQLPAGLRNRREVSPIGGSWYRDVRYPRWHVVVELDGRDAHPVHRAFRDYRRDNRAALAKETVLRYGWRDVIGNPCDVAAQVAQILAFGGWQGQPSPCSSGYTALAAFGQWPEM
jgi:very-short-patch-repair endonuclease